MRSLLVFLRWTAVGLVSLLLLVLVGLGMVTHTERFRQFVREKLIDSVNGSIRGSVSVSRLEGSVWGNVILHDLRIRYEDAEVLRVPRVRLAYSLLPLLWRRLQIFRLDGDQPIVYL
ncbi:MAG: hypothetical protein ACREO5_14030, partial [Candidatus Binatia bacterium]